MCLKFQVYNFFCINFGLFNDRFTLKTKNDWNDRKHFVKVEGKYGIVEVSHEEVLV